MRAGLPTNATLTHSVLGTGIAWHLRKQTKNSDLLAGNRTQTGTLLSWRLPPRAALLASVSVLH